MLKNIKIKNVYFLAAVIAWAGVGTSAVVTAFNIGQSDAYTPHLFGSYPKGAIGFFPRTFDWVSYFTEWSNLAIAISFLIIALRGFTKNRRDNFIHNISLVMITVTLVVNYLLLASKEHPKGIGIFTNIDEHYVTPIIAILLFLVFSPKKSLEWRSTLEIFYVAITYLIFTFVKGAITHRYPYGFLDVVQYGYAKVLTTTVAILVFAWLVSLLFFAINKVTGAESESAA